MVLSLLTAHAVPVGFITGNEGMVHPGIRQPGVNGGITVQPHPLLGVTAHGSWYAQLGRDDLTPLTRDALENGRPFVQGKLLWRTYLSAEVLPLRGHIGLVDYDVFLGVGYGLQRQEQRAASGIGPVTAIRPLTDSWSWHLGAEFRRGHLAVRVRYEQLHPRTAFDPGAVKQVSVVGTSLVVWLDPRRS